MFTKQIIFSFCPLWQHLSSPYSLVERMAADDYFMVVTSQRYESPEGSLKGTVSGRKSHFLQHGPLILVIFS